jgi:hypothetical protein
MRSDVIDAVRAEESAYEDALIEAERSTAAASRERGLRAGKWSGGLLARTLAPLRVPPMAKRRLTPN